LRRSSGILAAVCVGLLLIGCSGASVNLNIIPNPVVFQFNQFEQTVTVEIRTSGFGKLVLDEALVAVYDDEDNEVWSKVVDIGASIPFVVPGIKQSFEQTVLLPDEYHYVTPELYEEQLKGREFRLEIVLTGSKTMQTTAQIRFE